MYKQLIREQRYAIQLGLQEGRTISSIARQIGVSKSTVSREVRRNGNRRGKYYYKPADELASVRRERSVSNRRTPPQVLAEARRLLVVEDWSPRQISGWMGKRGVCISHERIYQMVRADETGELRAHTRHGMKYRRHKKLPRKTVATNIPGRVSIHQRPAEADGRRFGDWEMDLIVGKGQKSALLTLTERSTNYILMRFVPDKRPATVAAAAWRTLLPFKGHALKTITTDNGTEFAAHRTIAKRLGTTVYFADSYSAWQKGAVENANKLIRQYFPKGTDFNAVTAEQIRNVQFKINRRPREKLNFDSPKNVFFKFLR